MLTCYDEYKINHDMSNETSIKDNWCVCGGDTNITNSINRFNYDIVKVNFVIK